MSTGVEEATRRSSFPRFWDQPVCCGPLCCSLPPTTSLPGFTWTSVILHGDLGGGRLGDSLLRRSLSASGTLRFQRLARARAMRRPGRDQRLPPICTRTRGDTRGVSAKVKAEADDDTTSSADGTRGRRAALESTRLNRLARPPLPPPPARRDQAVAPRLSLSL